MNRAQRRAAAKGVKAQRRKGKRMNLQSEIGGTIQVTQTDMLAQIGALTLENTVLKNQISQANAMIQRLLQQQVPEEAAGKPAGGERGTDTPETKVAEPDPGPDQV